MLDDCEEFAEGAAGDGSARSREDAAGDGFAKHPAADWLNRAASWVLVTHTGAGHLFSRVTQSWLVATLVKVSALVVWKVPLSVRPIRFRFRSAFGINPVPIEDLAGGPTLRP